MHIAQRLSILALRTTVESAGRTLGVIAAGTVVDSVAGVLTQRFSDHSDRLPKALTLAQQQAWKALEIALAGDSFWDKCKILLATGEQKGFRTQVQKLLDETSFTSFAKQLSYRNDCLRELHAARKQGLLEDQQYAPAQLAAGVSAFSQYGEPSKLIEAEYESIEGAATNLRDRGHANLAGLIIQRVPGGLPLLVVALRYFFRRAVEEDTKLFQGLAFDQLEKIVDQQDRAFDNLHLLLTKESDKLAYLLDEVLATIEATHATVLDIQEEQKRQGAQAGDIYQIVINLQSKLDQLQSTELRPRDSLSIRSDHERQMVRNLVMQYRGLPEAQRAQLPALLNSIGKLEIAAGDFGSAQQHFREVALMVDDRGAQGEAHFNAYHAALERRDWATALAELQAAIDADPVRFMPFPIDKYRPQQILGAGGFGVAVLCRHAYLNMDVVVKTLVHEELDRSVNEVFIEGQALRQIDHRAIIRLQDCGYADVSRQIRPYLVMDYFPGVTLDDHVRQHGPLTIERYLQVAIPVAEGLQAAHARGILHRDVKPANLMIRDDNGQFEVRLIDFGLALRSENLRSTMATSHTLAGTSIAGTLEYAAPEQMGKSNEPIRATADVYGFARTACFAMFQTPSPLARHWRSAPEALAELLDACLEESPRNRPQSMQEVLDRLRAIQSPNIGTKTPARPLPPPAPSLIHTSPPATSPPMAAMSTVTTPRDLTTPEGRTHSLDVLAAEVSGCKKCPELVRSRTQTVFGVGPVDVALMILGEAPGADEDRQGEPFVGAAGQVLNRLLEASMMSRGEVYITNLLKCRPPANRPPKPGECLNCRSFLDRELELVKPRFILALGSSAAQNLLGRADSIGKFRGKFFDYRGVQVLCTYHPAYLLPGRAPEKKRDVWEDMKLLLRRMGREVPSSAQQFLAS